MADSLTVGLLKAVLQLDTAQYESGVQSAVKSTGTLDKTFKDVAAGMSYAGEQATASSKMIAGMGESGRNAAMAMQSIKETTDTFASSAATLFSVLGGVAVLYKVVGAIQELHAEATAAADSIADLSERTGLSTDTLEEFRYISTQIGTSMEGLSSAAFMLSKNLAGDSNSVAEGVRALGLSLADLRDMKPDEQFWAIVDALAGIRDENERTRIGVELFGRRYIEIAALVRAEVDQLRDAAPKMGEANIKALDEWGDAQKAAHAQLVTWMGDLEGYALRIGNAYQIAHRGVLDLLGIMPIEVDNAPSIGTANPAANVQIGSAAPSTKLLSETTDAMKLLSEVTRIQTHDIEEATKAKERAEEQERKGLAAIEDSIRKMQDQEGALHGVALANQKAVDEWVRANPVIHSVTDSIIPLTASVIKLYDPLQDINDELDRMYEMSTSRIDLSPIGDEIRTLADDAVADFNRMKEAEQEALIEKTEEAKQKAEGFRDIGREFQNLAQVFKDTAVGPALGGISLFFENFADFTESKAPKKLTDQLADVAEGIMAVWAATEGGGTQGILGGAAAGAGAGAAWGIWGAAAGAAIGAVTGALREDTDAIEAHRKAQQMVREETDKLAASFMDAADAVDVIRAGSDNASRAAETLSRVYEDMYGIANNGQTVIDALKKAEREGPEAVQIILDNINALMDRHKQIMQDWAEGVTTYTEGLALRVDAFARSMEGVTSATQETQETFDRLGTFVANAFAIVLTQSGSAIQALAAIQEPLNQLIALQEQLGLEGTETFNRLADVSAVVNANKDIFDALEGLQQMMRGLAQATILTSEDMQAFGRDATALFEELIGRGVDANQAMALMQPTLQALWEHQQKFHDITDEATLALLKQAEAAGLVGEQQKSINAQILDAVLGVKAAVEGVVDAVNRLPQAFNAANDAAKQLYDTWTKLPSDDAVLTGRTGVPKTFHTGGYVTAHKGLYLGPQEVMVKALMGETVVNPSVTSMLGGAAFARGINSDPWGTVARLSTIAPMAGSASYAPMSSATTNTGDINVTVNVANGDPEVVKEATLDAVMDGLERGGVKVSRWRRIHHQIVTAAS